MFRKIIILKIILLGLILGIVLSQAFSRIVEEKGKTYIVDWHGERWEIDQAMSIGFKPHRFQHGIGRNAFTPLDDSSFSKDNADVKKQLGFYYRFFGVFVEKGKWIKLLLHPILTLEMYFLRFLVGINYLLNS